MSGLEVVGVVASIVQLADFGARVAVKLHSFYHKIKKADISIQRLSTDVSLTSSVLKQLGDVLRDAEQQQLCSSDATSMAKQIVKECEQVFQQIESTIDKGLNLKEGKIMKVGLSQKLNFAFSESDVSVMQSQLDRLKATMLLLLHVMSYASQVRRREGQAVRKEQKDLIKTLLQEKELIEQSPKQPSTVTQCCARRNLNQELSDTSAKKLNGLDSYLSQLTQKASCLPTNESIPRPIGRYFLLIQSLLRRIDESKLMLDGGQRGRVREGILAAQSKEEERIRSKYGDFGDRICKYLFPLPETNSSIRRLPPLPSETDIDAARRKGFSSIKERPKLHPVDDLKQSRTVPEKIEKRKSFTQPLGLREISRCSRRPPIAYCRAPVPHGSRPDLSEVMATRPRFDSKPPDTIAWGAAELPFLPPRRRSESLEDIVLKWTNLTSNELAHDDGRPEC
jgi:hypothetical protein